LFERLFTMKNLKMNPTKGGGIKEL